MKYARVLCSIISVISVSAHAMDMYTISRNETNRRDMARVTAKLNDIMKIVEQRQKEKSAPVAFVIAQQTNQPAPLSHVTPSTMAAARFYNIKPTN